MLSRLKPLIVTAVKKECGANIGNNDVNTVQGYPWLGRDGRLRTVILIKGECKAARRRRRATSYMSDDDAFKVLSTLNDSFSKQLKSDGVIVMEMKKARDASVEDLYFDYTGKQKSAGGLGAGAIVGIIFLVIFLLALLCIILFLIYVTRNPRKFPKIAKRLPWLRKSTSCSSQQKTTRVTHTTKTTSSHPKTTNASHSTKPTSSHTGKTVVKETVTSRPGYGGRTTTRT